MTWKEFIYQLVIAYCKEKGAESFTLSDFYNAYSAELSAFAPENHHIQAKVRQQIQFLRKDNLLTFTDNHGAYKLSGESVLKVELARPAAAQSPPPDIREREYLDEIKARDRGWVRIARRVYGDRCLMPDCANYFIKDDGAAYIEVHHIDALGEKGADAINNLSVVCAHHHRMAHFAARAARQQIRDTLIDRTQSFLIRPR